MSPTNQQIYDVLQELKQQNNNIGTDVQAIKEVLGNFKEKIQDLEEKVNNLELENRELKGKIEILEESGKKNQIIVFNLVEEKGELLDKKILDLFGQTLEVRVQQQDIDNIFRIGKSSANKPRPIVVRFIRYPVKLQVLKNARKLKGTGITISNDLTKEQQSDQKLLHHYYKLAKDKEFSATVKKNTLIVNEHSFTVSDLRQVDELSFVEFFINKKQLFPHNSAPATPEPRANAPKERTAEVSPPKNQAKLKTIPKSQEDHKLNLGHTPKNSRVTRNGGRNNSTSGSGSETGKPKKQ